MDLFTDDDAKRFLDKEWLVKIDNANARPYLFKFCAAEEHVRSYVLITDTRNVWVEALDAKGLARRWRRLNGGAPCDADAAEDAWRRKTHAKLAALHTLKPVQECTFSVEDSRDADLAVELRGRGCTWRWECDALGPKTAAALLSAQLIMPLLSVTHLAFASADPVCELTTHDLEQAVDKVAKTGRRAQDVHVRQTLARPRVTTTLRRMTAMFHFAEPAPPIISALEGDEDEDVDEDVAVPPPPATAHAAAPSTPVRHAADPRTFISDVMPRPLQPEHSVPADPPSRLARTDRPDSATEPESDADADAARASQTAGPSAHPPKSRGTPSSDSSPARPPPKKAKPNVVPEDSSSGEERKKAGAGARRGAGVRQPLKRGGRRF